MTLVNQNHMAESDKVEHNRNLYRKENEQTKAMSSMNLPHKKVFCQYKTRYEMILYNFWSTKTSKLMYSQRGQHLSGHLSVESYSARGASLGRGGSPGGNIVFYILCFLHNSLLFENLWSFTHRICEHLCTVHLNKRSLKKSIAFIKMQTEKILKW